MFLCERGPAMPNLQCMDTNRDASWNVIFKCSANIICRQLSVDCKKKKKNQHPRISQSRAKASHRWDAVVFNHIHVTSAAAE